MQDEPNRRPEAVTTLRRAPALLAAVAGIALVIRLAVGGSGTSILAYIAVAAVTVIVLLAWSSRLDRRARSAGEDVAFACSTELNVHPFKSVPQFEAQLERLRMSTLVGGWLMGQLFVESEGVTWRPNPWTRRLFNAPTLHLPWREITHAAAYRHRGWRDPGILHVVLTNGAECAYRVNRTQELETALRHLAPTSAPASA
jgi:hypothetical protein